MNPTLARAYAHGPGKVVTASAAAAAPSRPRPTGRSLDVLADCGPFAAAVVGALIAALAPRRFQLWSQHHDHRAYPSARAAHAHIAVVRVGAAQWVLDPVRRLLCGTDEVDPHEAAHQVTVILHPDSERLPATYGELRDALATLEVGHVGAALAEAAAAAGLWVTTDVMAGATLAITLRPGRCVEWPAIRVAAARSSGLGPRGLAADPRPLPADVFAQLTEAALRVPPGSLAATRTARATLRHRLAVHHVRSWPDGVYSVDGAAPQLQRTCAATEALQSAFRLGPGEVDVAGMNVGWVIAADIADAVAHEGPDAYDRVLLSAGAAAQHICSAAAVCGLFCRPVRSVDEAATEAAVGATAGEDFLYLLLIGRPLVVDYDYDLARPDPAWRQG